MAYVFGAQDIIAALGLTASEWEVQESADSDQSDYAQTRSKEGNVIAASEVGYNRRAEKTITIKAKNPDGAIVSLTLGGVGTSDVVVTQFNLKEVYNDNASLSITAHKHLDTEGGGVHLAAPVSQAVSLSVGFGVGAVSLGGTLKDCQSRELNGSVEHTDKLSNKGKFLVGASHGLRFECVEEYVDNGSTVNVPDPWKQDSQDVRTTNGDFYTRAVRAHAFSL